jgi:hypothetical protein
MYLSNFLSAVVALYFMYLVCGALDMPEPAAVLAPVILEIFLPYFAPGGAYYYDFPELAFCALAVYVALKLDWWWAIPVAALGEWNKESFLLFIPPLYPFLRQRYSRNATLAQIAALSSPACRSPSPFAFIFSKIRARPWNIICLNNCISSCAHWICWQELRLFMPCERFGPSPSSPFAFLSSQWSVRGLDFRNLYGVTRRLPH